jgi:galactose mutarotase-like enzyme
MAASELIWPLFELLEAAAERSEVFGAETLQQPDCSITCQTLSEGMSAGVTLVRVQCGNCQISLLPVRGMGIWKASCGDLELGWQSPVRGPVHPMFVPIAEANGLGWLDGFDELVCRCGLHSNGTPDFDQRGILLHPLHGRIANLPARNVVIESVPERGELRISGDVYESRSHFHSLRLRSTLIMRCDEDAFHIVDEVTNLSACPTGIELLYHINLGEPVLGEGSRFIAPLRNVVPRDPRAAEDVKTWDRYLGPTVGYAEQVYFCDLLADAEGYTSALFAAPDGDRGMSLRFKTQQLPYFTLWKKTAAIADGYVTGLEPATNFPNARSFEEECGRLKRLAGGETATFEIDFNIHRGRTAVESAKNSIATLQKDVRPKIADQPQPDWCSAPPF